MSRTMLTDIAQQARRYVRSSLWVLRDGLRGAAGRMVMIVASDALGVVLAAGSIALVLLYARQAERGEDLVGLGMTVPTGASRSVLLIAGLALAGGVLSAASLFAAEILVHRLTRWYQRRCIERVLRAAARDDAGRLVRQLRDARGAVPELPVLATSTSKYCAFALRSLVRATLPLMYTLLSLAALIVIDWRTTLVLAGLGIFYIVPLVLINRRVASQHRQYHELVPKAHGRLRRGLRSIQGTSGAVRDERVYLPVLLDDPELAQVHDALYGRQLATKKVAMLNGTFFVLCLFVILATVALGDAERPVSWTSLLAYVVALRVAWNGVRQMTTSLVTANRFFHEFDLFADFTEALRRRGAAGGERRDPLAGPLAVPVAGGETLRIGPGEVVLVLDGRAAGRAGLEQLAELLTAGTPTTRRHVEDAPRPFAGLTVAEAALGVDGTPARREAWRDRLRRIGVLDELLALPQGLDTLLSTDEPEHLSADARYAIGSGAVPESEPAIVLQSLRSWRSLSRQFQQRLLRSWSDHAVVIADDTADGIMHHKLGPLRRAIARVAVVDGDEVVQVAPLSWLEEHGEAVEQRLGTGRAQEARAVAEEDLDDDV